MRVCHLIYFLLLNLHTYKVKAHSLACTLLYVILALETDRCNTRNIRIMMVATCLPKMYGHQELRIQEAFDFIDQRSIKDQF